MVFQLAVCLLYDRCLDVAAKEATEECDMGCSKAYAFFFTNWNGNDVRSVSVAGITFTIMNMQLHLLPHSMQYPVTHVY